MVDGREQGPLQTHLLAVGHPPPPSPRLTSSPLGHRRAASTSVGMDSTLVMTEVTTEPPSTNSRSSRPNHWGGGQEGRGQEGRGGGWQWAVQWGADPLW